MSACVTFRSTEALYTMQGPFPPGERLLPYRKGIFVEPNQIPLDRATLGEVLARVSFRLVERDYRRNKERYSSPVDGMLDLAIRLSDHNYVALSAFVASYATRLKKKPHIRLPMVRAAFVERARAFPGISWRSVAYDAYKAGRYK